MKKMFWFVLGLTMAVGCNDGFERDNPYDPDASKGIQAPASITGFVVSSRDAQPLDGAEVRIVELGLTSTTQADGPVSLRLLSLLVTGPGSLGSRGSRLLSFVDSTYRS